MVPSKYLQFGLGRLLGIIAVVAIILGMLRSFPATQMTSTLTSWGLVLNELAFVAIGCAIIHTVGSRSRYDFVLGFTAFAVPHWLAYRPPMGPGEGRLWHEVVIFAWVQATITRGTFDFPAIGFQVSFQQFDLSRFLYALETLMVGMIGGLVAGYVGRRLNRKPVAEAHKM